MSDGVYRFGLHNGLCRLLSKMTLVPDFIDFSAETDGYHFIGPQEFKRGLVLHACCIARAINNYCWILHKNATNKFVLGLFCL